MIGCDFEVEIEELDGFQRIAIVRDLTGIEEFDVCEEER